MQPYPKKALILLAVLTICGLGYLAWARFNPPARPTPTASGTIEVTRVELTARVAGILETGLSEGERVHKGQMMGRIIRNDLVAQQERDALAVEKARAQLDDLLAGARSPEIAEARAAVEAARTRLNKSQADFDRLQELYAAGAISPAELERGQADLADKRSQLAAATARLELLQAGSRENNIRAARVELERSQAVLKASTALLEDTKIISPLDGVVLTKNRQAGEFVPAGASIATVANLQDMWIKVYVPTDDLPLIKLGQPVSCTVSGSPRTYRGTVSEIATQGEFTPKTIQTKQERTNIVYGVKIKIDNQDGALKPGMPADVVFGE